MRFKKGSRVEVLKKCEVPSGSWWCATIISGNGRNYHVMYDRAIDCMSMERVPRKDMRPMPPPVGGLENLVQGDIVEVFHYNSWKAATVANLVDGLYFFVRLLGSSHKICVHKTNLRRRQSWHDEQWFVVGKDRRNCGKGKLDNSTSGGCHQNSNCPLPLPATKRVRVRANSHMVEDCTGFPEEEGFHWSSFSRRSLKRRSSICSSFITSNLEPAYKVRVIEGSCQRLVSCHQLPYLEKVDTAVSQHIMLGEKSILASFNNKSNTSFEADIEESINSNTSECYFSSRSLQSNEAESRACSVVSCSYINDGPYKLPYLSSSGYSENVHSDDADSSSSAGWRRGRKSFEHLPVKEEAADDTHRLELHAYRSTMEALYASGPISWEQEEMMTNLRLTLNISNDEHLLELRHLVSNEC